MKIRPKTILFSRNIKKGKRRSQENSTQYLVGWVNGVISWETPENLENYDSYSRLLDKFNNLDAKFRQWLDDDSEEFVVRNAFIVIENLRQSLPDPGLLDQFPFNKFLKKLSRQRSLNTLGKKYFVYNVIQYLKSQFDYKRSEKKRRTEKFRRLCRLTAKDPIQKAINNLK